jgi:hypothetical protein
VRAFVRDRARVRARWILRTCPAGLQARWSPSASPAAARTRSTRSTRGTSPARASAQTGKPCRACPTAALRLSPYVRVPAPAAACRAFATRLAAGTTRSHSAACCGARRHVAAPLHSIVGPLRAAARHRSRWALAARSAESCCPWPDPCMTSNGTTKFMKLWVCACVLYCACCLLCVQRLSCVRVRVCCAHVCACRARGLARWMMMVKPSFGRLRGGGTVPAMWAGLP